MEKTTISVHYGTSVVPLKVPQNVLSLSHTEPPKLIDPRNFYTRFLHLLQSRGTSFKDVGIVVSDKTRLCQYPIYLPPLIEALSAIGVEKSGITFYIAYGTHAPQQEEVSLQIYGETYRNYRFVPHDCRATERLTTLGTTSGGTRVQILKAVMEHDLLITFGAILHHYFAGFGGGRKLLFPGLAGYDSILQNHQLYMDFSKKEIREGCQSGNLETNPLAQDLAEINSMLPRRLEVHAILNGNKEVCEVQFGEGYNDFQQSCMRYDHFFRSTETRRFDMVVASGGGYPKDINFIQAHKSIHNAASFVKDSGTLLIFAACSEGIGNRQFMELFKLGGWDPLFANMAHHYENNAGTAVAMMDKARRIKIHFVTSLDQETCRLMGAIKTSPEEAQQLIDTQEGEMAWIANAGLLYR